MYIFTWKHFVNVLSFSESSTLQIRYFFILMIFHKKHIKQLFPLVKVSSPNQPLITYIWLIRIMTKF